MTKELIKRLTDICELVTDWNSNIIPTEKEFIDRLKKTIHNISVELPGDGEKKTQLTI